MKPFLHAISACILLSALPAAALGQSAPVVVGGSSYSNVLRAGTEVRLRTLTELSSREARPGDRFDLEVADDVMLNGRTVIAAGSRAVGEVTDVKKKGMWGKSGKIGTRLLYVRVGGQQVRISGQLGDKGKTGTAGVVGAIAFVPVAGFFVTGTSGNLLRGTGAVGYLDSDLPVVFASAGQPAGVAVN
jgi:hypothetical protein